MTRLPVPERAQLPPEAQAVWDGIAGPRGSVRGPHLMLMHVPRLAERVAGLGEHLRYGGALAPSDRELAILATGRELGAKFEWVAHEPIAREAGVRERAIEVVRMEGPVNALEPRERLIVLVVRSLIRRRCLPDDLYQPALEEFGQEHLIELITLVGFYTMIAFVLLGFDVDLPEGAESPFWVAPC